MNNTEVSDSNIISKLMNKRINFGRRRIILDYDIVTPDNVIEVLQKALNIHGQNKQDCDYLIKYFLGDQDILYRNAPETSNINNKTVVNYAFPITREIVGYTYGEPAEIIAKDVSKGEEVQKLIDSYNYESAYTTDTIAATYASICGLSYVITLPNSEITKDNTPEVPLITDSLDPRWTFVVQSNSIGTPQIMSCTIIRKNDGKKMYICYTDDYKIIVENMQTVTWEINPIGKDPIVMLENSVFLTGDWEQAIDVMNASNLVASDSLNDIEGTIRSLLVILGTEFEEGDTTTLTNIKQNRLLTLTAPNGANVDAKFISPSLDSTNVQNIRDYLDTARNIITGIPDRQTASGGDTGTAVINRNGWTDIEIVAKLKELFYKKSKKKQLAIGLEILKKIGFIKEDLNIYDIEVTLSSNHLTDLSTRANAFSTLVATGELATIDCLEISGLTNRINEVVKRGEDAKKDKQTNSNNDENEVLENNETNDDENMNNEEE